MTTVDEPVVTAKHGERVKGDARDTLTRQMVNAYVAGSSIRALADRHGRAYGSVHRMLAAAGVAFRPRGGAHR
jgi:hypothetical protein